MATSSQPIPFDQFQEQVLALYTTGRHAPSTIYRVRQVLRELAELGVASTADLTTATMARYVAARRGSNPNTINGQLGTLAALCAFARDEGWIDRPPAWRRVRLRPKRMTLNAPPTYDQVGRLLARLAANRGTWQGHRLCALAWTIALTGLRLNEALHARIEDVSLAPPAALTVSPRRRLKTAASAAVVPVPDALAAVLTEWLPRAGPEWLFPGVRRRGPWTGGSPGTRPLDQLQAEAAAVGIDRVTWHSLRHAYGTYALERWQVPLWVVQRVLRHTDARTTERYLHLDGSPAIAAAVRSIGYGQGGGPPGP